jgi:hypothetical protein
MPDCRPTNNRSLIESQELQLWLPGPKCSYLENTFVNLPHDPLCPQHRSGDQRTSLQ